MQNRENNLIKVKEAAEFLISTEFENADKKDEQYKLALKKAKAKIYTAIKKHQLDIFGETSLMTIYSQRLAGYLMLHGFVLLRLLTNETDNRNRFLFANTPALRDCIDKWQIQKLERIKNNE